MTFVLAFVFIFALSILPAQKDNTWTPPGWVDPLISPPIAQAATGDKIYGWGWSSNIGWVKFNNCSNPNDSLTCTGPDFGVTYDESGVMSGYAWSSNIGWLSFNNSDVSSCDGSTGSPGVIPPNDNFVAGWAKFLSANNPQSGGWDGCIKLSGEWADGVRRAGNQLGGFAWGADVVGWLKFGTGLYPDGGDGCTGVCIIEPPVETNRLTLNRTGNGRVLSNPEGIDCDTGCDQDIGDYNANEPVTLTATLGTGSISVTWDGCDNFLGNECDVTMDSDKIVTATFNAAGGYSCQNYNFLECKRYSARDRQFNECNSFTDNPIQLNANSGGNRTTPPVLFSINDDGASGISEWLITGKEFTAPSERDSGSVIITGTHVFNGNGNSSEGELTYNVSNVTDNVSYQLSIPYDRVADLDLPSSDNIGIIKFNAQIRLGNGDICSLISLYELPFFYIAGTVN